jgi:hypothetical protein
MRFRSKLKSGIFPAIILAVFIFQGFSDRLSLEETRGYIPQDTIKSNSSWPASFGLGRPASQRYIDSLNIDVRPDGVGLPGGYGTVKRGEAIYMAKCLVCHSSRSSRIAGTMPVSGGSLGPTLITDSLSGSRVKTIGNYWPYASTVYDYISRAMPLNAPGSLRAEEVYSLTAYLLYANGVIPESAIMDATSLPRVQMPAEKMFIPDDRTDGPVIR